MWIVFTQGGLNKLTDLLETGLSSASGFSQRVWIKFERKIYVYFYECLEHEQFTWKMTCCKSMLIEFSKSDNPVGEKQYYLFE